jgi:hypothetical protein
MGLQNEKFREIGHLVLVPSACALWFLSLAIAAAVYDSLLGPLSGVPPRLFLVDLSLVMTFLGFGASMMALAGAVRRGEIEKTNEPHEYQKAASRL